MLEFTFKSLLKLVVHFLFIAIIGIIGGLVERTEFELFIGLYALLFVIYYSVNRRSLDYREILIVGILARVILLFFLPELSNDFYRFIWDGELLVQGINPYDFKPNELISYGQFLSKDYYLTLYHGMGELSQANYSCYPILNQFIFGLSALFSDNIIVNVVVMKIFVLAADLGTFWVGVKILNLLEIPVSKIGWYFLNPLIILEFTGNLHFEGVMIFFIMLFVYYILKHNWILSGVFLGFAIQIKLIPFMFIPFVYKQLKWKNSIGFTAVTLLVVLLLSQLLLNQGNLHHFVESLKLYFAQFQFNASLFNWINSLYSQKIGWDTTSIVGPIFGKIALLCIILLVLIRSYKKPNDIFIGLTFALSIYYIFATTVHPWYLSLILVFSIFTKYKFGILWTFFAPFSYLAYADPNFTENKILNSLLYVILFSFIAYELVKFWRKSSVGFQLKDFFQV